MARRVFGRRRVLSSANRSSTGPASSITECEGALGSGDGGAHHRGRLTHSRAISTCSSRARRAGGEIKNDPKDVQWQSMGGNTYGVKLQSMTGKTMLIAGLGGIGLEVAKRAHGLGMKVIATRASSREGPDFVEYVGLVRRIADADCHAPTWSSRRCRWFPRPRTCSTSTMFARMKKTAYFINVGRGGSVVTIDLAKALQDGVIAGASVDVTEPEPLPPDHPLWKAPHVIITPHVSGQSELGVRVARDRACASRCAAMPPATSCCRSST